MIRDEVLAAALVLTFATLATAHVTLVAGLVARHPRARALVAFFVVPLAPYWGIRDGMRVRTTVWVVSACAYAALRLLAAGS